MSGHTIKNCKEIQNVEFDAVETQSPTASDSESDVATPTDWEKEAYEIRNRLGSKERSNENNVKQGNPPPPNPDNINFENKNEDSYPDDVVNQCLLKKGADTYEIEKYKKNAMIIFNHETFFASEKIRNYTMKDEEALKATFVEFGFEVESHLDLRKEELLKQLNKFCSRDFSKYGCICAVIMTHGTKNGWLRAYDTRFSEHEFLDCFNVEKNTTILGKPVIIIIQACRGDEPANAVKLSTTKVEEQIELDFDEPYSLPTEADRLIFHSSYVGRASVRVSEGSWFIQALCRQINLFAHIDDFETICRAVRKNVAIEKQAQYQYKKILVKQMPVVTTCLTRLLYLKKFEGIDESDSIRRDAQYTKEIKKSMDDYPHKITELSSTCHEYFDYLKRILRLFIIENPDDDVAQSILKLAENDRNIDAKESVKVEMVNLIQKYLNRNRGRFTSSQLVYLGRPCCCSAVQRSTENSNWCNIL